MLYFDFIPHKLRSAALLNMLNSEITCSLWCKIPADWPACLALSFFNKKGCFSLQCFSYWCQYDISFNIKMIKMESAKKLLILLQISQNVCVNTYWFFSRSTLPTRCTDFVLEVWPSNAPAHLNVCFCEPHLRAGTKEKCAAVLGEKLRGLSSGLVPERQKEGRKEKKEEKE